MKISANLRLRHLFLGLFFLLSVIAESQPTLSFRLTNPRIIRVSGTDRLEFQVEVKASASGTYFNALQATLNTTSGAFITGTPTGNFTPIRTGLSANATKYSTLVGTVNASGRIGISLSTDHLYDPGSEVLSDYFDLMPTTWTALFIAQVKISNSALVAGLNWNTGLMNINEFYQDPSSSGLLSYKNPNSYDPDVMQNLYMGRIYSAAWGWSQVGNTSNAQWVSWPVAVATSVYDTSANSATITETGSLASALRIHSGSRLTINPTKDLSCSGATEINEPRGLVIAADATGLGQFIDNGSITYNNGGSVRTRCYFSQMKWHYLCIPVASTTVAPFHNLYVKYYLEAAHNWKYISSPAMDSVLNTAMTGYALWSHSTNPPMGNYTVNLTGSLNTGSQSVPVTRTLNGADYDGYNLVGNPYCSALDLSSGSITWNDVEQKAWFWDPTAGNYKIYNVAGGGDHTAYCPPQQGFFVHHSTTNSTATSLAVTNSARVINSEPYLKDNMILDDYLVLNATSNSNAKSDEALVYFRSAATLGYDEVYDADKMWGDNDAPQFYSIIPDHSLTLNALPWTGKEQSVPMGFSSGVSGNFNIVSDNIQSFSPGIQIVLEDLQEHRLQNLNQNNTYAFTYLAGADRARFLIHFSNLYYGVDPKNSEEQQLYSCRDAVYVKRVNDSPAEGTLTLFNSLGQEVFVARLENVPLNKFTPGIPAGYYIAILQSDHLVITRKIALTN